MQVAYDVGKPLKVWTKQDSVVLAEHMRERIIVRTKDEGRRSDGLPMATYARGKKKGKTITLWRSGKMLGGLVARGTPARATVTVGEEAKEYAGIQDRRHPFMGFSGDELDKIYKALVLAVMDRRLEESSSG